MDGLGALDCLTEDQSVNVALENDPLAQNLSTLRSLSPVHKRPRDSATPRSATPKSNSDASDSDTNDTPSLTNHYHSSPVKSKRKHKIQRSADASTYLDALSPKSKKAMSQKRRSYMGMTKNQLQKECKKHKVARSLTLRPDKKEMVDILLLTEFASDEKTKSNGSKKKRRGSTKKRGFHQSSSGSSGSSGSSEEDDIPEWHRSTTWKSDSHVNHNALTAHLKDAHLKKSRRYDESLGLDISGRGGDIMAAMNAALGCIKDDKEEPAASCEQTKKKRKKKKNEGGKGMKPNEEVKRSQTPRGRRGSNSLMRKKRSPSHKRSSSVKKRNGKKGGNQIKINDESDGDYLSRSSTWRSGDHKKRTKQLKKAHNKRSYRYDEALDVKNDRASALFAVMNDIESEKENRKQTAKVEKGRSLLADELQVVEQDAMIDTLAKHYDSKKKGGRKSMGISSGVLSDCECLSPLSIL